MFVCWLVGLFVLEPFSTVVFMLTGFLMLSDPWIPLTVPGLGSKVLEGI